MHVVLSSMAACPNPAPYNPTDRRRRHICRTAHRVNQSVKNPYCGCPWQNEQKRCYHCEAPEKVQVRILYPAEKCRKEPCHFVIPPVPCQKQNPRRSPEPYEIDWDVDEPGPNDSYGLNGLNWYDWQMEYHNKEADKEPTREGLSLRPPPEDFPNLECQLPIECYSRSPEPIKCSPFAGRVDYSRDWRCCQALPPPPWKPPCA